jgi:uncharacterized protein YkwD
MGGLPGCRKGRSNVFADRSRFGSVLCVVLSALLLLGPGLLIASAQSSSDASVMVALDVRTSQSVDQPDAEQQLLALLNSARAQHGLPPLRMDRSLQAVARAHSHDMVTGGYVGHGSPAGPSALDRLSHVVTRGLVGENVTFAVSCSAAHRALVASSGHLENILEPRFHRVGIGVFSAGQFGMAVTQDFAE